MQPGARLGHYEILEAIGKGGMGEVWRAWDTKLEREAAIKTLPDECLASGATWEVPGQFRRAPAFPSLLSP